MQPALQRWTLHGLTPRHAAVLGKKISRALWLVAQVHAEHTVIVRTAMPDSGNSLEWREVSITNRVNVQVRRRPCHMSMLHSLAHWGRSPLITST